MNRNVQLNTGTNKKGIAVEFSEHTQFEIDYARMMQGIMNNGRLSDNRTGIETIKSFGSNHLHHSCLDICKKIFAPKEADEFGFIDFLQLLVCDEIARIDATDQVWDCTACPIITGRPIKFDVAWYETLMFLTGTTNTKYLEDRGISIWKGNTTREFLDNRGLTELPEKDLGKGYGYQWRDWNENVDQLLDVIHQMMNDPHSRRHVVSAWNPEQNSEAALDPCHILYQFNVEKGIGGSEAGRTDYMVDIQFYMRSSDVLFGLPFNMLSYYLILNIICGYLSTITGKNWQPRGVHYAAGDAHIYTNQIEFIEEYLERSLDNKVSSEEENVTSYPILALPAHEVDENLDFDDYLAWVEEQGYILFYDHRGKMNTPRPAMAV